MLTSILSSKFQIAIPKAAREHLDLKAGTKVHIIPYRDRIEFVPIRPMKSIRGFIKKKFDTTIRRKEDRI
jgi:AbrB family looped-hinge helix DNA binding protein